MDIYKERLAQLRDITLLTLLPELKHARREIRVIKIWQFILLLFVAASVTLDVVTLWQVVW